MPTGSSASTRRSENARLGVETTTRCEHTATKCLRRFIGRRATPASPPPDEAGFFQRQVVQGRGQVQRKAGSNSPWTKISGAGHVLSEISRVLRPGGFVVVGAKNRQ